MSCRKLIFLLLSLIVLVSTSWAQQPPRRTAEEYIKVLETERRIEGLQVDKVIATLKIKSGQRVGDLGSGSGIFTRPIAKKVGAKGLVYAIDVDPGLLKHVEKTAAAEKITNIKTILAAEDDAKIPEKVDLIIIIDTLHHIGNQGPYLKGLKKYLKPGGRVAIVDFSNEWPAGHESMRYSLDQLEGWMKDAGFKRAEKHDFLNNNFFVIYK